MVATWNPAASSGYYLQQASYYLGSAEPPGTWYAPGSGLGVCDGGAVERAVFERLFAGLDVDGKPVGTNVGGKIERVPAFDVTLSAPRSVSLAWAFADPETRAAIEAAQAKAARATLELLSREAAWARRGKGGAWIESVVLTAATFQHGESRPAAHTDGTIFADPNLHTHCVVLNLAVRADGSVGALHSTILRDWKMAAGANYHAALAAELHALGFGVDRIGKNGTFEVAGIADRAIEFFSARRAEIERELAKVGTTSGQSVALAAAVTRSTRKGKRAAQTQRREETWRQAALANGIETAIDHLRLVQEMTTDPEQVLRDRLAALPEILTATESLIDRRELVGAVAAALVGTGLAPERIEVEINRLLHQGHVVEIGQDVLGLPRYSTPEMIRIEQELVATAHRLAASKRVVLDPDRVRTRCTNVNLSAEQTEAALIATGPEHLAIIEGAPGTGKTTTLAPIVESWREGGYRVIGAASAWRIATMLRDDLGIEARATASWLEKARQGHKVLDDRTVLIVDEAGLLSSREMHALLGEVERTGARLLLVGDRNQLQAIGAGPGLVLAARAVAAARVETIVRQRQPWLRDAVTAFGEGRATQALAAFAEHECWLEAKNAKAAVRAVTDRWAALRDQHADASVLLLAKTNAEVLALGRAVREQLKAAGRVFGPEVALDVATPSGQPARIAFAAGDQIRFLMRHDGLGVINGTTAIVLKVEETPGELDWPAPGVQIEAVIGDRRIVFSSADLTDQNGRARLAWAYASTIYGAQGLTVDHAVVLLTSRFDRHDVYVASSRARETTMLVTDGNAIDREIAAERGEFDRHGPVVEPTARQAWLARRIDRVRVKESTFDAALPARFSYGKDRERTIQARQPHRTWEAGHER